MATQDQRNHILAVMEWLLANNDKVGYTQERPMMTAHLFEQQLANSFKRASAGQKVISPDCSEMVTMICRFAGLADPNGNSYNGMGNSDTMYDHLGHYINATGAQVGAIVCFGPAGATEHVAMVIEPGTDPTIFSHGSSRGPISLKLSAYMAAEPQQRPVTFLNISAL